MKFYKRMKHQLNREAKLMWQWPTPGFKYLKSRHQTILDNKNTDILDNFLLLKINIFHVDN